MAILQKEFVGLDADGNGEITVEELGNLLRSMRIKLKLSETQIKRAIRQIDTNGDGTIDQGEMLEILEKFDTDGIVYKALRERSSVRQDFERYDKDNSGFITKDEFLKVIRERGMSQTTEDGIDPFLKHADLDKDGKIDYEEFVVLMMK